MAFFGYDPSRYISNVGQTVASVGQQIGGAISKIPEMQQRERLSAQQEESNALGIQSQKFQQEKMKAAEEHIAQNPSIVFDQGEVFAKEIDESLQNLSPKLQEEFGSLSSNFRKSYQQYQKMTRLGDAEREQTSEKLRGDFQKINKLITLSKAVGNTDNVNTQNELRKYVAENFPTISDQELKGTTRFQSLPGDPKTLSELEAAKIVTEKAKALKLGAETDAIGITKGKDDRSLLAREERAMLSEVGKIDKQISDLRSSVSDNEFIVESFAKGPMVKDTNTGQFIKVTPEMQGRLTEDDEIIYPTLTNPETGVRTEITEEMSNKALRELEYNNKRLDDLTQRRKRQTDIFDEVRGGKQTQGEIKEVTQIGDYPTNWTVESNPVSKGRIRVLNKIKTRYGKIVKGVSEKYGVPENLFYAIMAQESLGRAKGPNSPKNATGLMQIMPENFKAYGIPKDKWKDPATNIDISGRLLKDWLGRYGKHGLETVIAAYNSKTQNILNEKWKKIDETRNYVPKIRGNLEYLNSLEAPKVAVGDSPAIDPNVKTPPLEAKPEVGRPFINKVGDLRKVVEAKWDSGSDEEKRLLIDKLKGVKTTAGQAGELTSYLQELEAKLQAEANRGREEVFNIGGA